MPEPIWQQTLKTLNTLRTLLPRPAPPPVPERAPDVELSWAQDIPQRACARPAELPRRVAGSHYYLTTRR